MPDVSTSLPQLDLQPNSVLTVALSDPAAKVTLLNVHGWQKAPPPPALASLPPLLAHTPDSAS